MLPGGLWLRHEGDVYGAEVVPPYPELELPKGLDEGHPLDVANRPAKLDDAHLRTDAATSVVVPAKLA